MGYLFVSSLHQVFHSLFAAAVIVYEEFIAGTLPHVILYHYIIYMITFLQIIQDFPVI